MRNRYEIPPPFPASQPTPEQSVSHQSHIRRVPDEVPMHVWVDIFHQAFDSEEEQRFGQEYFDRQVARTGKQFVHSSFYALEKNGEVVGIRWVVHSPDSPVALVPYGGVLPSHQGQGLYPELVTQSEVIMQEMGITAAVAECEDPEQIEDPKERAKAESRLRVFDKMGYKFVNPKDIPYIRNGAHVEDDDYSIAVDGRYLLGFKPLGNPQEWITMFDGQEGIGIERLRTLYMNHMQLETDYPDKQAMYDSFPSIQIYNHQLDNFQGNLVSFYPIPQKHQK